MIETMAPKTYNFIEITGDLIAAYVSNNPVPVAKLPSLIESVHAALTGLSSRPAETASLDDAIEKPKPAQIRKTVKPDGLVSFIDGKTYKTLKRHLRRHGLEPHSYRQRYGLPSDYPMVSAEYAARRSELAKTLGLGRPASAATPEPVKQERLQPKTIGRKKAA